jgi:hypothetical protein
MCRKLWIIPTDMQTSDIGDSKILQIKHDRHLSERGTTDNF